MENPTDEQIRQRAHALWEAAGKPEGQQDEFWLRAEQELKQDTAGGSEEKSGTFTE